MPSPVAPAPAPARPARAQTARARLGRAGLLAASLVLGLGLAEAAVRVAGLAPEVVLVRAGRFQLSANPRLGYEPVPDYSHEAGIDQFHDFVGRSNHLGFRDRDHGVTKPSGVYRILVLGDSVAAGQGVAATEDIFPARLEAELRAAGSAVEVLSFAVAGYHTGQEVEMLKEKGLAFAPDLVLVAYCLNDTRRDDGGVLAGLQERAPAQGGLGGRRIHPLLARSALYRLAWYTLVKSETPQTPARDTVDPAFDELGQLAKQHGFRVLVVVFPRFGKLADYPYGADHVLPATAAERNGFLHLDLLPAFQQCRAAANELLARDRYHPTAAGHACAAQATRRYLLNRRGELGLP